jgi:peptide/nickel transport system permease protein
MTEALKPPQPLATGAPAGIPRGSVTGRWLAGARPIVTQRRLGLVIVLLCAAAFVIVPFLDSTSPSALGLPSQPVSSHHLFGTDQLGRDIFARLFAAGRLDLAVTVVSVVVSACAGMAIGLVVASLPKIPRSLALRLIDATIAIPYLVLVLGLAAALGTRQVIPGIPAGVVAVVIALTIAGWAPYASLTLTQALVLRERESVVAARLLGYSYARILLRHIAPTLLPTNISYAATQAVTTTAALASLALLGVGVQEPTPELGQMMQEGIALLPVAWWISIIPGIAILVIGVGFGLIADSFGTRRRP